MSCPLAKVLLTAALAAGSLRLGASEPVPPASMPADPPCPGYWPRVSCCAQPSDTGRYRGDYVGGGCPCCDRPRLPAEGTWGWDYQGCLLPRYPFLGWCRCYRYQGGTGAYKTDGPPFPYAPHEKLPRH
jgi:hypothetical protein